MQKQDFNDEGLQLLLHQLYALPNPQLEEEALTIENDFSGWLIAHFLLNTEQLDDLSEIDPTYLSGSASQLALFVSNRWPVSLYKQQAPAGVFGGDRGKLHRSEQSKSITASSQGCGQVQTLSFYISYLQPPSG